MMNWVNKQARGRRLGPADDVVITLTDKGHAVGISLQNEARKKFSDYNYLKVGFDEKSSPCRIGFEAGDKFEGYHLRPNGSKSSIYFQCRDKGLVNFCKKVMGTDKAIRGQLRVSQECYFIEVRQK